MANTKRKNANAKGNAEELKRKFQEALEAKKSTDGDANASGAKGPGPAHDVHGQADHKRVFRRKSG
ncbi:MAG: hypothetical protein JWP10_415 [Nocardioidaceae bacterium]|nr:hypothetical protein [Nocardioidaceae bacterium]